MKFLLICPRIKIIGGITLTLNVGKDGGSQRDKSYCANCNNKHVSTCLIGMDNCFGCGKTRHVVRDCPMPKIQGKESNQAQESGRNSDSP